MNNELYNNMEKGHFELILSKRIKSRSHKSEIFDVLPLECEFPRLKKCRNISILYCVNPTNLRLFVSLESVPSHPWTSLGFGECKKK